MPLTKITGGEFDSTQGGLSVAGIITASSDLLVSGNLGLGINNPSNKVSILVNNPTNLSSSSDGIRITDGTRNVQLTRTGSSYNYGGVTGTGSLIYSYDTLSLQADTSNPIIFSTGSAERARIDSSGNFSIGTNATVSGCKLNVNTGINCNGLNVSGVGGFYNGSNKFVVDNNSGVTRFYSSGSNSSTKGSYDFRITDSVGTLDTSAVVIDSSGRMTRPYQPSANWQISCNTSTFVRTLSLKRDANNNVSSVAAGNGSSHGSVGRFTAPVAGVYLITIRGTGTAISGSNELLSVYGSWSTGVNVLNPTNEVFDLRCTPLINDGIGCSCTLYLSANDYWELDWYRPAPTAYVGSTFWDISTVLLG